MKVISMRIATSRLLTITAILAVSVCMASLNIALAETPAGKKVSVKPPQSLMLLPKEQILAENFSELPTKPWNLAKGEYQINDGVLKVSEKPSDNHGAVIRVPVKLTDAIISYDIKLDGGKNTTLSINDPKGHNSRVSISMKAMQVRKDSHDHGQNDKAELLDQGPVEIKQGEWHNVTVELHDAEIVAALDGQVVAFGEHSSINVEKSNVGLTVGGKENEAVSFRNFQIWSGTPNPEWDARKKELRAIRPQNNKVAAKKPAAKVDAAK
jgi:hypothetical protein